MIGQVIFQVGVYRETVILEQGNVQLVLCTGDTTTNTLDVFKLYRIDAPYTEVHGLARYTSEEAIASFQQVCQVANVYDEPLVH